MLLLNIQTRCTRVAASGRLGHGCQRHFIGIHISPVPDTSAIPDFRTLRLTRAPLCHHRLRCRVGSRRVPGPRLTIISHSSVASVPSPQSCVSLPAKSRGGSAGSWISSEFALLLRIIPQQTGRSLPRSWGHSRWSCAIAGLLGAILLALLDGLCALLIDR